MTSTSAIDARSPATDPVAAARELGATIRAAADDIERERRLPGHLVELMRSAGLFHLFAPAEFGGLQADPVTAGRAVEETAYADGSTGWCVMIAAQNSALTGMLEANAMREILTGRRIIAGVARPIGRAVADGNDAFIVSGRWPFASGSSHADWLGGECTIYEGDEPRRDAEGNPVTRMLLFPASEATIHDTWHTTGLRGTASQDFSVEGVRVPARYGFQMLVDPPLHSWPLYRAIPLVFVTHGAHAIGVARAEIDAAKEIAATKPGWGSDRPVRENTRVQAMMAEAVITLESARHYMYDQTDMAWQRVLAGESDLAAPFARMRLATSHAATAAVRSADLVHDMLATSAIFTKSPLERPFRDIHTAAAHVMVGPLTYEAAGRVELGLPAGMPFF